MQGQTSPVAMEGLNVVGPISGYSGRVHQVKGGMLVPTSMGNNFATLSTARGYFPIGRDGCNNAPSERAPSSHTETS